MRSLRRAGAAAFKLSSAASVGRMRAVGVGRGDARVGGSWCGPVGAAGGASREAAVAHREIAAQTRSSSRSTRLILVKICLRPGTTKSLELRSTGLVITRLLVEAVEEGSQRPRAARFHILEAVPSCFSDRHGRRRSGCTARLCWISSLSVLWGTSLRAALMQPCCFCALRAAA